MSKKVRLKQERSATSLTLEVPVTVMHVALMQQVTLLTGELCRTLGTPATHTYTTHLLIYYIVYTHVHNSEESQKLFASVDKSRVTAGKHNRTEQI